MRKSTQIREILEKLNERRRTNRVLVNLGGKKWGIASNDLKQWLRIKIGKSDFLLWYLEALQDIITWKLI